MRCTRRCTEVHATPPAHNVHAGSTRCTNRDEHGARQAHAQHAPSTCTIGPPFKGPTNVHADLAESHRHGDVSAESPRRDAGGIEGAGR